MIHAVVYARLHDGRLAKGLEFETWTDAVIEWEKLDNARHAGLFPHVKHFEVRDPADPKYANAERLPIAFLRTIGTMGFGDSESTRRVGARGDGKAARAAWKRWAPTARNRGYQGEGGWYFHADGRVAAQGMNDLANVARRHNLIVQGANGRWFVTEAAQPSYYEAKVEATA
jgi:hypothetical protein